MQRSQLVVLRNQAMSSLGKHFRARPMEAEVNLLFPSASRNWIRAKRSKTHLRSALHGLADVSSSASRTSNDVGINRRSAIDFNLPPWNERKRRRRREEKWDARWFVVLARRPSDAFRGGRKLNIFQGSNEELLSLGRSFYSHLSRLPFEHFLNTSTPSAQVCDWP